jgi:hypothetical protein
LCHIKKMNIIGSTFGYKLKTAKWLLSIAVFLFVAKPFVGFSITPANLTAETSILVKSFTKRKHDYVENSSLDVKTVQKKLADPVNQLFLLFSGLLGMLFVLAFEAGPNITSDFLRKIKLALLPSRDTWLLDGQLII